MPEAAFDATEVHAELTAAGLTVTPPQSERLAAYLNLLARWNRVYNLTGLHDRQAVLERHLVESLALGPMLKGPTVADIGTGAGLPGMPLAICHPALRFTLIESRRKRVNFLRHVVATLAIGNVEIEHARAEHLSSPEAFATVLARAVAPPAELLAIARPLLAEGGRLLLLTSAHLGREIAALATDFEQTPVTSDAGIALGSSIVLLEHRRP